MIMEDIPSPESTDQNPHGLLRRLVLGGLVKITNYLERPYKVPASTLEMNGPKAGLGAGKTIMNEAEFQQTIRDMAIE